MDRIAVEPFRWNYLNELHPDEVHNAGGDCPNPRCDYHFTPQDYQNIQDDKGWFQCPKCGETYNLQMEQRTRALGLTSTQMGQVGENLIASLGSIPGVGQVMEHYGATLYNNPIDFHIGPYGVEVKSTHSEASPRFKLSSKGMGSRQEAIQTATAYCNQRGLIPALLGVRLNFYTSEADLFFRQSLQDMWATQQFYIDTVNFASLNPYKDPSQVPPPSEMGSDDPDSDIPW